MGLFNQTIRFKPDGYYNGVPYRAADGGVEAVINGDIHTFKSVESFIQTAIGGQTQPAIAEPLTALEGRAPSSAHVQQSPFPPESVPVKSQVRRRGGGRFLVICLIIIGALFFLFSIGADRSEQTGGTSAYSGSVSHTAGSVSQRMVDVINREFGRVCSAKLEGIFSTTLRLDWTSSTTKLHAAMVLAAIGKSKESLYDSGIRYLKFPNDAGGYNIIDWKTGDKTSVDETARYYFR